MGTWHILTGEYPPDVGGVADYTASIARALNESGDVVHVWTGGTTGSAPGPVTVHRVFGRFERGDVGRGGRLLDEQPAGGRLLVQWVPHAFGRRGVNLPFAQWLHDRSVRRNDPVDVMVHEPFVPFSGSASQRIAAVAQRAMTALALNGATRAFAGTPSWIEMCRPFARRVSFRWTPIPSGIPPVAGAGDAARWRRDAQLSDVPLIGCFGRGGALQERAIAELGRAIVSSGVRARLLPIGLGSETVLGRIVADHPELGRIAGATGTIGHANLSAALKACDVMVQCYADGISTRHSSAAAVLAHGCPIVANEGRFTESIWRERQPVALVRSIDAMPATVFRLLGDDDARRRLSRAALATYDATFDVRHTIAALKS